MKRVGLLVLLMSQLVLLPPVRATDSSPAYASLDDLNPCSGPPCSDPPGSDPRSPGPIKSATCCGGCSHHGVGHDCLSGGLLSWLGLRASGHLNQGINFSSHGAVNPPTGYGNLPGAGLPYRSNEYMLNQLYVTLERPTDGSDGEWDFGGRVDLAYGTDYIFLRSRGLETEGDFSNKWNGDTGSSVFGRSLYGLAMPQMYAEVACDRLKVRAGHFYSLMGHEGFLPTENFYYTSSYALFFNGYGESVPVTGLQLQYNLTDQILVAGELHRGQVNWEDNNDHLNLMGLVEWQNADGDLIATYSFDIGPRDDAGENSVFAQSVILEWQITESSSYILNSSYGFEENVATGGGTGQWYGIANYFAHDLNEQWTAGMRYELYDNVDGVRTLLFSPFTQNSPGVYHAITTGLNYKPCSYLKVRPEVRWDWFAADGNAEPGPFGDKRNRFLFALDVLLTF